MLVDALELMVGGRASADLVRTGADSAVVEAILDPAHAPDVADAAYVAPTATLIGDVAVGADASIWFGAILRGDSERIVVGEQSNVQDGAILHADPQPGPDGVVAACVEPDDSISLLELWASEQFVAGGKTGSLAASRVAEGDEVG